MATHDHILDTIGNTPVVKIGKLAPAHVDLFVKVEAFNPLGSVKDRLALGIIEDGREDRRAEARPDGHRGHQRQHRHRPGHGLRAEGLSAGRRPWPRASASSGASLMRFLGAKVVLTPAAVRGVGMVNKAVELAKKHGWFWTRQFENEANPDMHSRTTAQEILADFKGEPLDYWVTGYGTGGTLKGVARVLRKERPDTKIIVCEPDDAPLLDQRHRRRRATPTARPPAGHPPGSRTRCRAGRRTSSPSSPATRSRMPLIDQLLPIAGADALRRSRELARQEGIFVGITAGATFAGALKVAETRRRARRSWPCSPTPASAT